MCLDSLVERENYRASKLQSRVIIHRCPATLPDGATTGSLPHRPNARLSKKNILWRMRGGRDSLSYKQIPFPVGYAAFGRSVTSAWSGSRVLIGATLRL
jgi:hypothetical protein